MRITFDMRDGELWTHTHIVEGQNVVNRRWRDLSPEDQKGLERDRAEWEAAEEAKKPKPVGLVETVKAAVKRCGKKAV